MKLSKSQVTYLIVALLVVFGLGMFIYYKNQQKLSLSQNPSSSPMRQAELSYELDPNKTQLAVGDKVKVPLYLKGADSSNSIAFDIRINYDSTKLKLTSATPGDFLPKYLTVKWDLKQAWFALALTPQNPKLSTNPASPIMTLEFTALAKSSSAAISTGVSTVYVSKTGGFHPQAATVNLTIN